jgi:hypothetical protein
VVQPTCEIGGTLGRCGARKSDSAGSPNDAIANFYNFLCVFGWFYHPEERFAEVNLLDPFALAGQVGLPHGGAERDVGPNCSFVVEAYGKTDVLEREVRIEFATHRGRWIKVPLLELLGRRREENATALLTRRFQAMVRELSNPLVVDTGGRGGSTGDRTGPPTGSSTSCPAPDYRPFPLTHFTHRSRLEPNIADPAAATLHDRPAFGKT